MKKIVVAMDSFKGSLSSIDAGRAMEEAAKKVYRDVKVTVCPMADGGEGTVEAIVRAHHGQFVKVDVCGPLGEKVEAVYGLIPKTKTAVIEMSAAAGIVLVPKDRRNPMHTTTFGVGEMIKDAVSKGCRRFVIGIGGSATNDGGVGMLAALGFSFLDAEGKPIALGATGLKDLAEIRTDNAMKELKECSFCIACDVTNILCGEKGCSAVFGPQKGATAEMIRDMDWWLLNFARLTKKEIPTADETIPGTGAAGGLGFAFLSYLNAMLVSGTKLVIQETGLENHIKDADLVITGEGRLDGQTCMGKAPSGVAEVAKKYHKPVIAFSGCAEEDAPLCHDFGIDAFFPIIRKPCTMEEAMDTENAYENLKATAEQVFRLLKIKI